MMRTFSILLLSLAGLSLSCYESSAPGSLLIDCDLCAANADYYNANPSACTDYCPLSSASTNDNLETDMLLADDFYGDVDLDEDQFLDDLMFDFDEDDFDLDEF